MQNFSKLAMVTCFAILIGSSAVVSSCGGDGDSDGESGGGGDGATQTPQTPGQAVGLNHVTGSITLSGQLGGNYQVWLVNQTDGTYTSQTLAADGIIFYSLEAFAAESEYSIHLITPDLRHAGAIDFDADTTGVQGVVTYDGTYGFDLGELTVTLLPNGTVDRTNSVFTAAPEYGFSVVDGGSADLSSIMTDAFSAVSVSTGLIAQDPGVILNGFYLGATNTERYSEAAAELARVAIEITPATDANISLVAVNQAGSWIRGSRQADLWQDRAGSVLWHDIGYYVPEVGTDGNLAAYPYTGRLVHSAELVFLQIFFGEELMDELPVGFDSVVAWIPQVAGVSFDGGTVSNVDYTSDTATNGLTRPFCASANDVILSVSPPRDRDGVALDVESLDTVSIEFQYLAADDSVIAATTADLAAAFQVSVTDSYDTDLSRSWAPADFTVSYALGSTSGARSVHELRLWEELFISSAADATVELIRLRILYSDTTSAMKAGTIVLIDPSC